MTQWMTKAGLGTHPIDDSQVQNYAAAGWSAAADPSAMQGGMSVDPSLPYYQWLVEQQLAGARVGNDQAQTGVNQYGADTNRLATYNNLLGTAAQAYFNMRDPANIYQTQALMAGDPRPGLSPAMAALGNLIGGLPNSYVDPRQYRALTWKNSGFEKAFGDAGDALTSGVGAGYQAPAAAGQPATQGTAQAQAAAAGHGGQPAQPNAPGAIFQNGQWVYPTVSVPQSDYHASSNHSEIEWKRKLEQAGIKVGDANPDQVRAAKRGAVGSQALRDLQDGRYGMSNRALPYAMAVADPQAPGAQPGSGGAPPGVRLTNGHPADDPTGDHTPHNDDGTPYVLPQAATTDIPQQPAPAAPVQQVAAAPAAPPAAPSAQSGQNPTDALYDHFYNQNTTMSAARQYGTPKDAIDMGDNAIGHVTKVPYTDGSVRFFTDDGTEVQSNPNSAQPNQQLYLPKPVTQATVGAPTPQQQQNGVGVGAAAVVKPPTLQIGTGVGTVAAQSGSAASSNPLERAHAVGAASAPNVTAYSASGRNISGTTDKSDAEKAADRARRQEEARAGGGTDILGTGQGQPQGQPQGIAQGYTPPGAGDAQPLDQQDPSAMAGALDPGGETPGPQLYCTPDGPGTCTVTDAKTQQVLGEHVPESEIRGLLQTGQAVMIGPDGSAVDDGGGPGGLPPGTTPDMPQGAAPTAMAQGGTLRVVSHPFHFSVLGHPFLVGEPNAAHPDGADELVSVAPGADGAMAVTTLPLQNRDRPVTPAIAHLANALVPGSPYHPTTSFNGVPAYAAGYQYHPPMQPTAMALGGTVPVYGGAGPQPLTVGTLKPSFKPFKLSSDEKKLGLYSEGKFVSDTGQVQAPTGKGGSGGYRTMPQFQTFPLTDESEVQTTVAQQIQDDPLLANSINSALSAAGRLPASYWARINSFRAPQQAPLLFAQRQGF